MSKRSKEKKLNKQTKQRRARPEPGLDDGPTLHVAAGAGTLKAINQHLEAGADPDLLDRYGQTPLMVAVGMGQRQAVGALLAAGASLEPRDSDGRDLVINAARQPDVKILEQLLQQGADPTRLGPHGETALGFALHSLKADHVALLREAGAPEPPGAGAFEVVEVAPSAALEADLGDGGVRLARLTRAAVSIPAGASLLNAFNHSIGLSTIAGRWHASDRPGLEHMLAHDLIHAGPLRSAGRAADLAGRFMALLGQGQSVTLFTTLQDLGDGCHSYTPVSRATFNAATMGVTDQRIGIIWVDQED